MTERRLTPITGANTDRVADVAQKLYPKATPAELCAKLTGNTQASHLRASRMSGANPNHPGIPKWEPYNDNLPMMIFDKLCVLKNDPDGDLRKAVLETIA